MSFDRRSFLWQSGGGLGGVALVWLLGRDRLLAADKPKAKARRVVQLFMSGAASQCDLFDYKPKLVQLDGQKFDPGEKVELFQSSPGAVMASPWKWKQYGKCGKWVSDLAPHIGSCVDDICFLQAMYSRSNVHGPATFLQATGFLTPGFPSVGAWVSYGLGRLTDELPAFVVIPDSRGFAPNGPANWGAGFLPAEHQGTALRPGAENPIYDLFPPADAGVSKTADADAQELLRKLNEKHRDARPADSRLAARIASYEMAARLQVSAPQVLDLSKETDQTKQLYGLDRKE